MRTARRRAGHPSGPLTVGLPRRAGSASLVALLALGTLGTLGACSDDEASGPCEQPEHQRAQLPASHVLPGQPEPSYLSDPPTSGPCEQPEHQRAQLPASHVLPGQPEPSYLSDPPTSGPHAPITSVPPVFAEPVPKPTQVGILERGMVLVQYQPDLPAAERQQLLDLAGGMVAVAPNPQLGQPVVASAWLYLLRCDALDTKALGDFIDGRTSEAPGGH